MVSSLDIRKVLRQTQHLVGPDLAIVTRLAGRFAPGKPRAKVSAGHTVLEVGCGTGYFTVPLANLIGDQGCLVAIDVLPQSVELVSRELKTAGLNSARVIKADAMDTCFEAGSFDVALLFGVIPAPMLPLNRLLQEMHRVLKADGSMAVWPPIPGWLPQSIIRSGLFTLFGKLNGVHRFRRC